MRKVTYFPLSESALLIEFGTKIDPDINNDILQLATLLSNNPFPGFIESVPAYTTLTVYFDPMQTGNYSFEQIRKVIEDYIPQLNNRQSDPRTVHIPVCYDSEFGIDLDEVASANYLSAEEVIRIHTEKAYHVYFLGFSPGFPFLGGMSSKIATPRRETPRLSVPAGSVGIAGRQTGIYPIASPGGWQIIGRTPTSLLQLDKEQPTLLQPGDRVSFYPITKEEYYAHETEV